MPDRIYTNLYGEQVTVPETDRGDASEQEKHDLAGLDQSLMLSATWAQRCESRFVQRHGRRQVQVRLWGADAEKPKYTVYYSAIPQAATVLVDVMLNRIEG